MTDGDAFVPGPPASGPVTVRLVDGSRIVRSRSDWFDYYRPGARRPTAGSGAPLEAIRAVEMLLLIGGFSDAFVLASSVVLAAQAATHPAIRSITKEPNR